MNYSFTSPAPSSNPSCAASSYYPVSSIQPTLSSTSTSVAAAAGMLNVSSCTAPFNPSCAAQPSYFSQSPASSYRPSSASILAAPGGAIYAPQQSSSPYCGPVAATQNQQQQLQAGYFTPTSNVNPSSFYIDYRQQQQQNANWQPQQTIMSSGCNRFFGFANLL